MFSAGILLALLASCNDDGQGRKPNIFGEEESFVRVEYTSNADTVYLRWTLTDKDTRFDSYQVTDNRTNRVVTVGSGETSCFLTHIPYAEPVSVYLSLMQDGKVLKTNKTDLVIDGLDRVTAGIIIPDRGSVTGGDGMYSIALPDGRSIFLMGDSYTGTVTAGRRSTSDHMYRNSYILYDDGQVSALVDANGPDTSGAVPPGVVNEGQKWYWPGHGFVADNTLYIFQTVMYQGEEGMWGFRYETTDILEYELPEVRLKRRRASPSPARRTSTTAWRHSTTATTSTSTRRSTSTTVRTPSRRCWRPARRSIGSTTAGSTTPVRAGASTRRMP